MVVKQWSNGGQTGVEGGRTGGRGAGAGDAGGRAVGGVEAHVAEAVPGKGKKTACNGQKRLVKIDGQNSWSK